MLVNIKHRNDTYYVSLQVHPSHGCSYISFGGSEIPYKHYEVLCRVWKYIYE